MSDGFGAGRHSTGCSTRLCPCDVVDVERQSGQVKAWFPARIDAVVVRTVPTSPPPPRETIAAPVVRDSLPAIVAATSVTCSAPIPPPVAVAIFPLASEV